MPRTARQKSKSGIYHIILRGANRQEIFHNEQDCLKFLEAVERCKNISEIKIYGWCLMNNHIHLLLEEGKEDIGITMKRIGVSFVSYYNWKYGTTGHLFQDRYRSEAVEDDRYLMTVLRYIHQNPIRAGLVEISSDWKWSSCRAYYGNKSYPKGLLDSEFILGLFFEDKDVAIKRFNEFNEAKSSDKCLDDVMAIKLRDEEARLEIKKIAPEINIAQIKSLPKEKRDEVISNAKRIKGVTQRQLARIIGVSQTLISTIG